MEAIEQIGSKIPNLGGRLSGENFDHLYINTNTTLPEGYYRDIPEIVRMCRDQIKILELSGSDGFLRSGWGDSDIAELPKFTRLECLTLNGGDRRRTTDETLLHISKIISLQSLDLHGLTESASENLTLAGLKMLRRLPKLDLLTLPKSLSSTGNDARQT